MAKKKRKPPPRPAASRGAAPTVTVAPAVEGGPNRQARKEEARRRREAIRRKMARRRTMRVVGAVLAVLVVAAAVGVYIVVFHKTAAEAAGCTPVKVVHPYRPLRNDRSHITAGSTITTPPELSSYSSVPPASGPHDPTPLDARVYPSPPGIYHAIHSLEHGAVEIWYAPSVTSSSELAKIRTFYAQPNEQDHVIVAPYSYADQGSAGHLPAGKVIAFVAWHHIQLCEKASPKVAQDFVTDYRFPTGTIIPPTYKGDAPERGSAI